MGFGLFKKIKDAAKNPKPNHIADEQATILSLFLSRVLWFTL